MAVTFLHEGPFRRDTIVWREGLKRKGNIWRGDVSVCVSVGVTPQVGSTNTEKIPHAASCGRKEIIDLEDRERLFDLQLESRVIERAMDPQRPSETGRAVVEKIRGLEQLG